MFKSIFNSIIYLLEASTCLCIYAHMRCFLSSFVNLPKHINNVTSSQHIIVVVFQQN